MNYWALQLLLNRAEVSLGGKQLCGSFEAAKNPRTVLRGGTGWWFWCPAGVLFGHWALKSATAVSIYANMD